ncbi:C39 family peptidase [Halomonas denitrificans]|nr:C39 family peptidase [Halomonas denitrificans]
MTRSVEDEGTRIEAQPDTTTCGPTCLHALYRHFGEDVDLDEVIDTIRRLDHGGTLDVFLANHALGRGYSAEIYTYNLGVFDPTWFEGKVDLAAKLEAQEAAKDDDKLSIATAGYLEFLAAGGRLRFADLTRTLIRRLLRDGHPVLTGLSATYLYRSMREWGPDDADDDIRGLPVGHFVLLTDYDRSTLEVGIADPMAENPHGAQRYRVHIDRVIGAILLGSLTYDANLVVLRPGHEHEGRAP